MAIVPEVIKFGYAICIFRETALRKTTHNTVHHSGGGVGSVVGNHRSDGGSSVTVTSLIDAKIFHGV